MDTTHVHFAIHLEYEHVPQTRGGQPSLCVPYTLDFKCQKKIITSGTGAANCKVRSQGGAKKPYCFVILERIWTL